MPIKELKSSVFSFFISFSIDSFFVLFIEILLSRLDTVLLKFVFATKAAFFNVVLKTSSANVLNSEVVIFLS